VTRPTYLGGLGFDLKWNMGWMNDTLRYIAKESIHRQYHQDMLTFSMLYAFTENFLLPFSHDEVTHGKRSMLYKMPGDEWQRFANLRLLYTYMFTHPGKKLLFMGCEIGQGEEWTGVDCLDWYVLDFPLHQGVQRLVRSLNRLYRESPELHRLEFDWQGFEWIDCNDALSSVLVYQRRDGDDFVVVALNFTPVTRTGYRIGVPRPGDYLEIFCSDGTEYGGSGATNGTDPIASEAVPWMDRPQSLVLTLPPLGRCNRAPRARLSHRALVPRGPGPAEGRRRAPGGMSPQPAAPMGGAPSAWPCLSAWSLQGPGRADAFQAFARPGPGGALPLLSLTSFRKSFADRSSPDRPDSATAVAEAPKP
jgi:alpha-1,4-glucan:alpha-1,4-glucan 6-glycosyltransferase